MNSINLTLFYPTSLPLYQLLLPDLIYRPNKSQGGYYTSEQRRFFPVCLHYQLHRLLHLVWQVNITRKTINRHKYVREILMNRIILIGLFQFRAKRVERDKIRTHGDRIGLEVQRSNHSAILSCSNAIISRTST